MAEVVFVEGDSGSGKTTSIRNFDKDEIVVLNVSGKRLPLKKDLNVLNLRKLSFLKAYAMIKKVLKTNETKYKAFVIDDANYLMSFEYFDTNQQGYEKFNDIGGHFKSLIDFIQQQIDDNVIVYIMLHMEMKDDGKLAGKTVGKMLDEKIKLEGLSSVVISTVVTPSREFLFKVHGDGTDQTKTPMGMFETDTIPNDLKEVDKFIRTYWGMTPLKGGQK